MKKLAGLILIFALGMSCYGQTLDKWVNVTAASRGTTFYNFANSDDQLTYVVVTRSAGANSNAMPFIRKYNEDFSSFEDMDIPETHCATFQLMGFSDKIILNGSTKCPDKPSSSSGVPCNQVVMGFSPEGKVLFEQEYRDIEGQLMIYSGDATLFNSSDQSKIIVVFTGWKMDNSTGKYVPKYYIHVYDEDLIEVWNDSIAYEEVMGEEVSLRRCKFDFTPSGKLVIVVDKQANRLTKCLASIDIYVYEMPGQIASKESKTFDYEWVFCKQVLIGETLFVSGKTYKQLFTFQKNCSSSGIEAYNQYPLKDIFSTYKKTCPELKTELGGPAELVPMVDGVLYMSNYAYTQNTSMPNRISGGISLIKFGFDGKLQWVKMIRKSALLPVENAFLKVYPMNNDLVAFYGDNPLNITSTKPGIVYSRTLWGLGVATISPDGTIKKTLLEDRVKSKINFDLSSMHRISDNQFVLKGKSKVKDEMNTFFGIISF